MAAPATPAGGLGRFLQPAGRSLQSAGSGLQTRRSALQICREPSAYPHGGVCTTARRSLHHCKAVVRACRSVPVRRRTPGARAGSGPRRGGGRQPPADPGAGAGGEGLRLGVDVLLLAGPPPPAAPQPSVALAVTADEGLAPQGPERVQSRPNRAATPMRNGKSMVSCHRLQGRLSRRAGGLPVQAAGILGARSAATRYAMANSSPGLPAPISGQCLPSTLFTPCAVPLAWGQPG